MSIFVEKKKAAFQKLQPLLTKTNTERFLSQQGTSIDTVNSDAIAIRSDLQPQTAVNEGRYFKTSQPPAAKKSCKGFLDDIYSMLSVLPHIN